MTKNEKNLEAMLDAQEPAEAPSKPLLFADDRTDVERFDPRVHAGTLDASRIPGYSEIVQANDIDKADDLLFREANDGRTKEDFFRQIGARPQTLPVEFAWLRVSGAGGADSSTALRDLDWYKNREGFRLASPEDLSRYGYGFPPAARTAEDGSIRRGPDTALFVRSGEVAQMWHAFKDEEQKRMEGNTEGSFTAGEYETESYMREEDRETVTVKH